MNSLEVLYDDIRKSQLRNQYQTLEQSIKDNGYQWVFWDDSSLYEQSSMTHLIDRFGENSWLNHTINNTRFGIGFGGSIGSTIWFAFRHDADAIVFKMAYGTAKQWDMRV